MTVLGPVYGTTNPANSGFTNPANAQGAPNGVYATAGASASTTYTDTIGGFSLSSIPDNAALNTVTLGYRYTITESRNTYQHSVVPMVSGSAVGTAVSSTNESGATSGGGSGATEDITGTIADLTVAEMKNAAFQLQGTIQRTAGTRTYTYSLDSVWITVDYSTPQAYSETPTDQAAPTDSVTFEKIHPESATDTEALTDSRVLDRGLGPADTLALTDTTATVAAYSREPADTAGVTDTRGLDYGLVRTDQAALADEVTLVHEAVLEVTDSAGLAEPTPVIDYQSGAGGQTLDFQDDAGLVDSALVTTPQVWRYGANVKAG